MWPCAFHFAKGHPCNVSWEHATVWSLDVLSPGFSHCSCWCFRNFADIAGWRTLPLILWSYQHIYIFPTRKNYHQHTKTSTTWTSLPPFPSKALLWSMSPVHQAWVPYPTSVGHGHVNVHHPPRLSLWWWESWPHALQKPPGHDATEKVMLCTIWRDKHDWDW